MNAWVTLCLLANVTTYHLWPESVQIRSPAGCSNFNLPGNLERIVYLDSHVPHRAFELRVARQELYRTQVDKTFRLILRKAHGVWLTAD